MNIGSALVATPVNTALQLDRCISFVNSRPISRYKTKNDRASCRELCRLTQGEKGHFVIKNN